MIGLMTYLIGIGGYAHIVAGSVESFLLVVNGEIGVGTMLTGFTFPVLLGNIVGGYRLVRIDLLCTGYEGDLARKPNDSFWQPADARKHKPIANIQRVCDKEPPDR